MRDRIIIYGCGGHARSVLSTLQQKNEKREIVLVDYNAKDDEKILDCKVVRTMELGKNDKVILAIGDNKKRTELYKKLCERNTKTYFMSVLARTAIVGKGAKVGDGVFIGENAYIGPEAKVGNNTIINTASIIEHETLVGENAHIAPNVTICGRCKIGNNVFIGAGSVVKDNISIIDNVIIGAGSVVVKNIFQTGVYIGIPARKLRDE